MSATSALAAVPAAIADEPMSADVTNEPATKAEPASTETSSEAAADVAPRATAEQPATESGAGASSPAVSTSERVQAVARIRQSALPPALRERLAAVVETGQSPSLDVAACLEALEETLPDFLRTNRHNPSRPAHPSGDAFFKGGDCDLTDAEAETIAQHQLARSGLLRGQRVKVAN